MSVFVARMSSLSFFRSETQVPSPPPISPSPPSGPRLAPPASDTTETATACRTVEGSTRSSFSSWTVPGIFTGSRNSRRSTPTSTPAPAVTATHHRLPSNQPGFFGSVNQRSVPTSTNPRNAKAANASTTPNNAAYPISRQNPGDRATATTSEPGCDPWPDPDASVLTSERLRAIGDATTGTRREKSPVSCGISETLVVVSAVCSTAAILLPAGPSSPHAPDLNALRPTDLRQARGRYRSSRSAASIRSRRSSIRVSCSAEGSPLPA